LLYVLSLLVLLVLVLPKCDAHPPLLSLLP
jgi:hypothetical protein